MLNALALGIIYDYLIEEIDKIFQHYYHPCHIRGGACHKGYMYASKGYGHSCATIEETVKENSFCCNGCEFLGDNGCTTQSIQCKLWFCGEHDRNATSHPGVSTRLDAIRKIASNLGFTRIREGKEANVIHAGLYLSEEHLSPAQVLTICKLMEELSSKIVVSQQKRTTLILSKKKEEPNDQDK